MQSDATGCLRREIASPRDKAPGRLVLRFQSAYKVAQSLQLARKESDSSQAALQHARNQQLSYVMQARDAPQILPEDVVQHQLAIAEVREHSFKSLIHFRIVVHRHHVNNGFNKDIVC